MCCLSSCDGHSPPKVADRACHVTQIALHDQTISRESRVGGMMPDRWHIAPSTRLFSLVRARAGFPHPAYIYTSHDRRQVSVSSSIHPRPEVAPFLDTATSPPPTSCPPCLLNSKPHPSPSPTPSPTSASRHQRPRSLPPTSPPSLPPLLPRPTRSPPTSRRMPPPRLPQRPRTCPKLRPSHSRSTVPSLSARLTCPRARSRC